MTSRITRSGVKLTLPYLFCNNELTRQTLVLGHLITQELCAGATGA